MSYVHSKIIFWSIVADAASYNIYVRQPGEALIQDRDNPSYVAPNVSVPADPVATNGQQEYNLARLGLAEGIYDFNICAVDAAGNESDPLDLAGATIDLTAPAAPADGGFR